MPIFPKQKDKDKVQQAQHQQGQPDAPTPPPALPARPKSIHDFPAYAAAKAKLDSLHADFAAANAEADQLRADLGRHGAADETTMAAMELLGQGSPGATAEVAAKQGRLKAAASRVQVITRAIQLHQRVVDDAAAAAWREVLHDATPAWRALLVRHAEAVVAAARSRLALLEFNDHVEAGSPIGRSGFGDYTFAAMGHLRDHSSAVSLWVAELVGTGVLTGREAWLSDAALIARGPDGATAVDRPAPPASYNQEPPPPAKRPGLWASLTGRTATPAAAGPAPRPVPAPDGPALPPMRRGATDQTPTPAPPATRGPVKQIKLLRPMATMTADWPAGAVVPWEAGDAARMVKAGVAEYADAPAEPAASH